MAKLSAFITSTLAIAASALPADNKPRVCGQVSAPEMLISTQKFPDPTWHGTPNTNFAATQSFIGGALEESFAQIVAFKGPVGSYGCQVSMTFPEDITQFYAATHLDGNSNPPTLNVYKIKYPVSEYASYDEVKKSGLFGTATVRPGNQVINTGACPTAQEGGLAFLFEIPDWIHQSTAAYWNNSINSADIKNSVGVYLNYNC